MDCGGVSSPHKHIGTTCSSICSTSILANAILNSRDPDSIEDQHPNLFGQSDCSSLYKQHGRNTLDPPSQVSSEIMDVELGTQDMASESINPRETEYRGRQVFENPGCVELETEETGLSNSCANV